LLKVPGFRRYVSHEVSGMPAPFKRMNIFSWNDSMRLTKTQSYKIHSKEITRKDNLP